MPASFSTYTYASLKALKFNLKSQDTINKKQEILVGIEQHYMSTPDSVLFVGFSPLMLGALYKNIYVTDINIETKNYLDSIAIKYTYIDTTELLSYTKQFSWVVAGDEYFTFATTEQDQQASVSLIASLAKELIVTTLRDYKNQNFREREFSQPLAVYNHNESLVFLEHHKYEYVDKNAWQTTVFEMQHNESISYGPFARRNMFFKQLAKFSIDSGAKQFYVHKDLMYKSLIRKNYEHVISISI
jgi:hypothetical protein